MTHPNIHFSNEYFLNTSISGLYYHFNVFRQQSEVYSYSLKGILNVYFCYTQENIAMLYLCH